MFLLIQSKYENQDPLIFNRNGAVDNKTERVPFFSILSRTLNSSPVVQLGNLSGYKRVLDGTLYSACKYMSNKRDTIGRIIPFTFVISEQEIAEGINSLMVSVPNEYMLTQEEISAVKECLSKTQHKSAFLFFLFKWIQKIINILRRK